MNTLRCSGCLYEIHVDDAGELTNVVQEGGVRRPSGHPALAAWRVLYKAHRGEGPPAARPCDKCDQPMLVTEGAVAGQDTWTLSAPQGEWTVGETVLTPDGQTLDHGAADVLIEDQLRERMVIAPFSFAMQSIFLTMGLAPLFLWLAALFVALWMFLQMAQGNLYQ